MEFKNVFLINCNEENIPHVNSIENNLTSRFIKECNIIGIYGKDLPFKEGDIILHKSFGRGKVISITSKDLDLKFEGGIIRKFDTDVLYNNCLISKVD